ncbi:MAG: glycosyltransferase family 2 protein [Calditrichaeota bacterium]|nr:glycosyltransferase family 2 protein [Calditrichota bacterium]
MLRECLDALSASQDADVEAVIVDNGSGETPSEWGVNALPVVQILHYPRRMGFAAACNRGVEAARGKYIFLLNNDAVVEPDTVRILVNALETAPDAAAVVPKILNYNNPTQFDYSSAAGGALDRFGFPFARGRIFDHIEQDAGQYDRLAEVFWGAGAALMLRRDLWLQAGGLEQTFFAHMEEIDLLWRMRLIGYRVLAIPQAVVRHRGAATIRSGSFLKAYLNHRNSLAMLLRNYSLPNIARYVPARLLMDAAFAGWSLIKLDFKNYWAVIRAWFWLIFSINSIIGARKRIQGLRKVSDDIILKQLYAHSVVWKFFIGRKRTFSDLS